MISPNYSLMQPNVSVLRAFKVSSAKLFGRLGVINAFSQFMVFST